MQHAFLRIDFPGGRGAVGVPSKFMEPRPDALARGLGFFPLAEVANPPAHVSWEDILLMPAKIDAS